MLADQGMFHRSQPHVTVPLLRGRLGVHPATYRAKRNRTRGTRPPSYAKKGIVRMFKKIALTVTAASAATIFGLSGGTVAPAVADDVSPKNVIILIGDGMGYNHVDHLNAATKGEMYYQVDRDDNGNVIADPNNAPKPTEGWQSWDHAAMYTTQHESDGGVPYDAQAAWNDFDWVKADPTDSAAAGTAMATGVKTYNAGLGVDVDGNVLENLSQRAHSLDKSAGVVTSVPFSHATPAAYSAHNASRNAYGEIAEEQARGDLDVVMGAGHPMYDDNHQKLDTPKYKYITEETFNALSNGQTEFEYIESNADFEALTTGDTPDRVFGIAQVGSTLQQSRSEGRPLNDVVDLPTMTRGALNVLDNNENGFHLMIEGGAIDWAGHGNNTPRDLEEVADFDAAIDEVINWVETNSSWDETLVIITADHETGYLNGPTTGEFNPMLIAAEQGATPAAFQAAAAPANEIGTSPELSWNSPNHTRQLVGLWAKGPGAEEILAMSEGEDPVRGSYIDNTAVARYLLDTAWVESGATPEPTQPTTEPTTDPTTAPTSTDSDDDDDDDDSSNAPSATDPSKTDATVAGGKDDDQNDAGSLAKTGATDWLPIAAVAALFATGGATLIVLRRSQA